MKCGNFEGSSRGVMVNSRRILSGFTACDNAGSTAANGIKCLWGMYSTAAAFAIMQMIPPREMSD